ncbi:alpha/beta fold hydrolase [Tenacibaculum jejuense]|uniref:Hydrolase n=1 Tax=Tenacibaculum jejuense TaxID=584609 RepID=A0A238UEN9_9FLAO|nr:alpha/beta hydrolase [Tenacibaculum jejuense]SNR17621.1 Hydrolase [Tenacibaculum jejuense]
MVDSILYKNAKVAYQIYGAGKQKLVLLHGFLENAKMWNFLTKEMQYDFQIITVDLLGHGASECLGYVHTMEEIAETIHLVLKKEKIVKATFIGHSMGGYVALAFAEKYPDYVERLCLLNSTSSPDSEERKEIRDRAIKMAKTNYKTLVAMSVGNLFARETYEKFGDKIEACKQEALKTKVQGYIACSEGMKLRKNRSNVLQNSTFKKLIIAGKKDPVLTIKAIQVEADHTKTPLQVLSNGHMSHIENEEELVVLLKDFCLS